MADWCTKQANPTSSPRAALVTCFLDAGRNPIEAKMSVTGLSKIDDTVHTTNVWLKQIMTACHWTERQDAYRALRVTLHALRDHLPIESVAHLSAQLPTLIRGLFFEGWRPGRAESSGRDLESFIQPIQDAFDRNPGVDPEHVARAVFETMCSHISEGEMHHVERALPRRVRRMIVSEDQELSSR